MKSFWLTVCFVIGIATVACAAPFLWSDGSQYLLSDPNHPTSFLCKFDSGSYVVAGQESNATNIYIKHDLSSISNGNHSVVCQACNVWGCSTDSSPFACTKAVPINPASLRIQ